MGILPLELLALNKLAESYEEVDKALGWYIRYLPPKARERLLAVARRRCALDDARLERLFCEPGPTVLDISGSRVTDSGIRALSDNLRTVVCADLRASRVGRESAELLTRWAPRLEVLRVDSEAAKSIATELCRPLAPTEVEHWEELLPSENNTLRPLPHLKILVWPGAGPYALIKRLKRLRPDVVVVGRRGEVLFPSSSEAPTPLCMPPESDTRLEVDDLLVHGLSREAVRPPPGATKATDRRQQDSSLADRFKRAFEQRRHRATRMRGKEERFQPVERPNPKISICE